MTHKINHLPRKYVTADKQRGVLLIVTMILLLIISGVAAITIKGSGSSENVANNTRTQALAMQAAEAALRYAETDILEQNRLDNTIPPGTPVRRVPIAPAATGLPADWTQESKMGQEHIHIDCRQFVCAGWRSLLPDKFNIQRIARRQFLRLVQTPA